MNQDGRCTIKLLSDYIQYRVSGDDLVLLQDKISLNKVPLDYFLSRKEYRILRLLLKDRGSLVTRQQLAEVIWQDHNEEYSDWAIDQLMTRLRKRLESLSLSSTILQSVRGKGYILRKESDTISTFVKLDKINKYKIEGILPNKTYKFSVTAFDFNNIEGESSDWIYYRLKTDNKSKKLPKPEVKIEK